MSDGPIGHERKRALCEMCFRKLNRGLLSSLWFQRVCFVRAKVKEVDHTQSVRDNSQGTLVGHLKSGMLKALIKMGECII